MKAEEMVALAGTIKILNDDDALELFKQTFCKYRRALRPDGCKPGQSSSASKQGLVSTAASILSCWHLVVKRLALRRCCQ